MRYRSYLFALAQQAVPETFPVALRALVYLALHPGRLCTVAEIAGGYGISLNHLTKVVQRLAARGYIETVRGKGGGLRLAREPAMIRVGAVVRDMEERFDLVECLDAGRQGCPLLPACALKAVLSEANRNFLATLDARTLADVLPRGRNAGVFLQTRGGRIPVARAG